MSFPPQQSSMPMHEKPYSCDFSGCPRRYTRPADATRHYDEKHNPSLDAVCPVLHCSKVVSDARKSDKQRQHMREQHPAENGQYAVLWDWVSTILITP